MLQLQHGQLSQLIRQLERSLPFSSSIHHLANEQLRKRLQWPGVSFVVDTFPNFSVCIARTCCSDGEIAPFVHDVGVFVHSTNSEKLQSLLEHPQCLDWNRRIYFRVVKHPDDSDIVVKTCKTMDGTTTIEGPAVCVHFDLSKNPSSKHELPNGFVIGELNENHAEQLIQDRNFGCPKLNLLFYRYILKNYPSAAIFEEGCTVPVAYIAYRPEGCLALGYTNPKHRGRGFLKLVVQEMLRKLKQLGFTHTCGYAAADNHPSVKGMLAAGGFIVENYQPDFIQYIPRHWTEDQCLSRFQA